MHLFHIPQCSIQNMNVHISVLNGALWVMEQMHSVICELGQSWFNYCQLGQWLWGRTCRQQLPSKNKQLSCKCIYLKISSSNFRQFCLGLNVLIYLVVITTRKCSVYSMVASDPSTDSYVNVNMAFLGWGMSSGGHYWDYHRGTPSYLSSHRTLMRLCL